MNLRLEERRAGLDEAVAAGDWSLALKEAKSLSEINPQDEKTRKLLAFSEARCREKVDALFSEGLGPFRMRTGFGHLRLATGAGSGCESRQGERISGEGEPDAREDDDA